MGGSWRKGYLFRWWAKGRTKGRTKGRGKGSSKGRKRVKGGSYKGMRSFGKSLCEVRGLMGWLGWVLQLSYDF
jgi:hypothetical protein